MSTERSRRRADGRSTNARSSGKTRKYHFARVQQPEKGQDDWLGVVLPPKYYRVGPKNIGSDGTRVNLNGLIAHLFFWDTAAIPKPYKASALPESFELLDYCHNVTLSVATNDNAFLFTEQEPFEEREFFNRRSVKRSEIYRITDMEWENQLQTFFGLEEKDRGRWSVSDPYFQHRKLKQGRSLLVRLHDAIPVPSEGVSLLEVVEFKSKFRPQLLNLRRVLAKLYLKIEASQDSDLEFRTEFQELADAIAGVLNAMENASMRSSFATLDNRLFWDFDYRVPLAAAVTAGSVGELSTALIAAAGGAVANLIPKIEISVASGKVAGTGNPLAYATLISRSFGDSRPYDILSSDRFLEDEIEAADEAAKERQYVIGFANPKHKILARDGLEATFFINEAMIFSKKKRAVTYLEANKPQIKKIGRDPRVRKME